MTLGLSTKCFLRAQTPLADEIERPPLRGGTRTRDLLRDRCAIYNGLGNRRLQSCLLLGEQNLCVQVHGEQAFN
jgi:hypothetical protein